MLHYIIQLCPCVRARMRAISSAISRAPICAKFLSLKRNGSLHIFRYTKIVYRTLVEFAEQRGMIHFEPKWLRRALITAFRAAPFSHLDLAQRVDAIKKEIGRRTARTRAIMRRVDGEENNCTRLRQRTPPSKISGSGRAFSRVHALRARIIDRFSLEKTSPRYFPTARTITRGKNQLK